ncbi:MAG TPA: DUF4359 domain-containing protein [Stenomitos sp.]
MAHQPPPHHAMPLTAARTLRVAQWTGGALALGLGIMLRVTNPTQETYTDFATKTVSKLLIRDLCRANDRAPKLFDSLVKNGCQVFQQDGETEIRAFIAHNTERQDFFLFSLYTTEFPIRPLRVLGIFDHFFLL